MAVTRKQIANLKPPVKGEVRNPKGRPKGVLNHKTVLKKWLGLTEKVKNPVTGKMDTLNQLDIITLGQLKEARKGNTQAFKALLEHTFGKPKQTIDLDIDGDLDVTSAGESIAQASNPTGPDLSKLSTEELRTLVKLQKKLKK